MPACLEQNNLLDPAVAEMFQYNEARLIINASRFFILNVQKDSFCSSNRRLNG